MLSVKYNGAFMIKKIISLMLVMSLGVVSLSAEPIENKEVVAVESSGDVSFSKTGFAFCAAGLMVLGGLVTTGGLYYFGFLTPEQAAQVAVDAVSKDAFGVGLGQIQNVVTAGVATAAFVATGFQLWKTHRG